MQRQHLELSINGVCINLELPAECHTNSAWLMRLADQRRGDLAMPRHFINASIASPAGKTMAAVPLGVAAGRVSRGGCLACGTASKPWAACSVHHILPHLVCLSFQITSPAA